MDIEKACSTRKAKKKKKGIWAIGEGVVPISNWPKRFVERFWIRH